MLLEILLSLQIAMNADIGATAPLPQCGTADEDHKRCSREGEQGIPGGALEGGPVAYRGSGRDVARGCTGGDCRGEFPETVPQPDRTKGLA